MLSIINILKALIVLIFLEKCLPNNLKGNPILGLFVRSAS